LRSRCPGYAGGVVNHPRTDAQAAPLLRSDRLRSGSTSSEGAADVAQSARNREDAAAVDCRGSGSCSCRPGLSRRSPRIPPGRGPVGRQRRWAWACPSRVLGSGGREQSLVFDRHHDGLEQQPWHRIDQSGRRIAGVCRLNEHIAWLASRVCDVPLRSFLIPSEVPPSRSNVLPGCGWD
jgi:hypothetical protein